MAILKYCHHCGSELPHNAAYCPSCGQAVWQPQIEQVDESTASLRNTGLKPVPKKLAVFLLAIGITVTLVGYAWHLHLAQVRKTAAEASAKAAAEASASRAAVALSQRVGRLVDAQFTISGLISKMNAAAETLNNDISQAAAASERRHSDSDIFSEYDEAQTELSYVKKAQSTEVDVETFETQDCEQHQSLYGTGSARQLCSDFASTNESRENQITEWLRAVYEIVDNLNAAKALQAPPYSSSEIVMHYTTSDAAAASAEKLRKMGFEDGSTLDARLQNDIAAARAQRSQVIAGYPKLVREYQNPFMR